MQFSDAKICISIYLYIIIIGAVTMQMQVQIYTCLMMQGFILNHKTL